MTYLYSWLKDYCPDLPTDETELSALLLRLGHDIDQLERYDYPGIVIGEITSVAPHPQADRLSLTTVKIDQDDTEQSIVCGAPQLAVGQKVAVALPGTVLACGITLKPAKIRGIESHGMLLAGDELAINRDHSLLWYAPDDAIVGKPVAEYLPPEYRMELKITHNRGDVLSHYGLARDLAAGLSTTFNDLADPATENTDRPIVEFGNFHPECDSFAVQPVTNLTKLDTPTWLSSRLNLIGQKSYNAPIDITNYILFDLGQPLHAYDADKLAEPPRFSVRRAHEGESFETLEAKTITLNPDALVVTNHDEPVALAGVIGGQASAVTGKTKNIIFEAAHFAPKAVALMMKRYGLTTEAGYRWVRGVDPAINTRALSKATALLAEASNGQPAKIAVGKQPIIHHAKLTVPATEINRLLGSRHTAKEIGDRLAPLGLTPIESIDDSLTVSIPTWRTDISIPVDIAEELVRLADINTIPATALGPSLPTWKRSRFWQVEKIKDILVRQGLVEIVTYPFVSRYELKQFSGRSDAAVELKLAPIGGDRFMRQSLLPALYATMSRQAETPVNKLFEINKIYYNDHEETWLAIGLAGPNQADLDHAWQNILELLHLPVGSWMSRVVDTSDDVKQQYKLRKQFVTAFTAPIDDILSYAKPDSQSVTMPEIEKIAYQPVAKFPPSRRDLAIIVDAKLDPVSVTADLRDLDPLIVDVEHFDTFTSPSFGADRRSLAFHLTYQSPDHTLTDGEVDAVHQKVEDYVKEHYHGQIR